MPSGLVSREPCWISMGGNIQAENRPQNHRAIFDMDQACWVHVWWEECGGEVREHLVDSKSSLAARHIGRHLGLAHHSHCELIYCMMPIDPIFHIVWIMLIHPVGELRHDDFEE